MTPSRLPAEKAHARGFNAHLVGLAIAGGTLMVAVAVAFLWPPTYAAHATVVLEPQSTAVAESLDRLSETEVATKLAKAIGEDAELRDLARDMLPGSAIDEQGLQRVRAAIRVVPHAPRTYRVEFRGRQPAQVERVTNELARRVAERAAVEIGIAPTTPPPESDLERRTRELADFVAGHPELALDAPQPAKSANAPETATDILRKEQAQLELLLARSENARNAKSDNPYAEPLPPPDQVRARLARVKDAIAKRERAQKAEPVRASPELQDEWQRLVKALAVARQEKKPVARPPPSLKARVLASATFPQRPDRPNRPLILGLGSGMAAGWYALCLAIVAYKKHATSLPRGGQSPRPASVPFEASASPRAQPAKTVVLPQPGPGQQQPAMAPALHAPPAPAAQPLPPTDPVSRTSSRPPPGAGVYSVSVRDPGSDPPPPEHLTPLRKQESNHRTRTPPRNDPVRQPQQGMAAPEPAPAQVAPRGSPVRRPMKRTVTLIHGSFIEPDGSPTAQQAYAGEPIETTAVAEDGQGGYYEPVPPSRDKSNERAQTPTAPALKVKTVRVAGAWAPNIVPAPRGWLDRVRDEVYGRALHQFAGRCFVVMVTSSGRARDQKSQAAAQLALSLSESGHPRILLVEGDFDRPMVHHILAVEMPRYAGFSQQMHARIQGESPEAWTVVECRPTLHVLAEGRLLTPGLLNSYQFDAAVNELKRYYEVVLISAPPLSGKLDMRALESVADGVIVVDDVGSAPAEAEANALFGNKLIARVQAQAAR